MQINGQTILGQKFRLTPD